VICAEFRSSHRGLLPLIRQSWDQHRPPNLSTPHLGSTQVPYYQVPTPRPHKRPYSLGIYTCRTQQTILVSIKPTTVIKQLVCCCTVCWLQSRFYCCWIFYGFYVVFISLQRFILHCSEAPELVNITAWAVYQPDLWILNYLRELFRLFD